VRVQKLSIGTMGLRAEPLSGSMAQSLVERFGWNATKTEYFGIGYTWQSILPTFSHINFLKLLRSLSAYCT